MNTSFEEKSAWITAIGLVVVFGIYCAVAGQMLVGGVTEALPFVPVFTLAVVLLVALLVGGHVAVAIASRPDGRDERDRLITWRAEHDSSWLLGAGVIAAVFCLVLPIERGWIANGLLAALFLSEIVNYALRLYYYRRGL